MLSAEGLRHAFGEGRGQVVALDGVSFNLAAGQTLAVFGPNGAGQVLERFGMGDRGDQPVWSLSRGLAQRAAIAKAVIHDPRVLLLDEPFTGLDLAAAAELRALLGELRGGGAPGGGRVVVLATHNVDEGVELATDVAFQRRGRFVHFAPRAGRGSSDIAEAYRRAVGGTGTDG